MSVVVHVGAADVAAAPLYAGLVLGTVGAAARILRTRLADDVVEGEGAVGAGQLARGGLALLVVRRHHAVAVVEIGDGARAVDEFEAAGGEAQVRRLAGIPHRDLVDLEFRCSVPGRAQVHVTHRAARLRRGYEGELRPDCLRARTPAYLDGRSPLDFRSASISCQGQTPRFSSTEITTAVLSDPPVFGRLCFLCPAGLLDHTQAFQLRCR